jgi:hypothetical protein
MAHHLKTVVQGTVMLAVQKFAAAGIGDIQNTFCISRDLPAIIDFKFHPEETISFPIEDRRGFVVVILDDVSAGFFFTASLTIRVILIFVEVTDIIIRKQNAASNCRMVGRQRGNESTLKKVRKAWQSKDEDEAAQAVEENCPRK